jgi:hypothetical protein
MFVNFSNHPSTAWDEKQRTQAMQYGEIVDVAFPDVAADSTEAELDVLADQFTERILQYAPACVMCQGEFTLTYRVINRLKEKEVPVVAACSQRKSYEQVQDDGTVKKISVFQFCQFRKY